MSTRKSKKKVISFVIKGADVIKGSGGFMPPSFKTGAHMTAKDRPRDKNWKRWI